MRPLASQRSLAMLTACFQIAGMKKAFREGSAVWTRTLDDNFAPGCVASAADGWTVVRLVGTDEVPELLHTRHAPAVAQNAFAGVDRARRHSDHALRGGAVAREFDGAAPARGARDIAPAQVPLCGGQHLRASGANAHASFAAPFRVFIMASRLTVARISFRARHADVLWRCAHRVEPIRAHRRAVSGLNTPRQTGPSELHLVVLPDTRSMQPSGSDGTRAAGRLRTSSPSRRSRAIPLRFSDNITFTTTPRCTQASCAFATPRRRDRRCCCQRTLMCLGLREIGTAAAGLAGKRPRHLVRLRRCTVWRS